MVTNDDVMIAVKKSEKVDEDTEEIGCYEDDEDDEGKRGVKRSLGCSMILKSTSKVVAQIARIAIFSTFHIEFVFS